MSDETLIGRWRLKSWSARAEDGSRSHPFGADAEGTIIYTATGWMTGILTRNGRPNLSTQDLLGGSEQERAAAFSTYVAYCGTYEIQGNAVVHHVTMSLFPNWVGADQVRYFELSGDHLVLRTAPLEVAGHIVVNELEWTREESFLRSTADWSDPRL